MQNYKITIEESDYKFSDLIDVVEFEELLESFYKATGVPNGIVSNNGEIISQKGWVSACSLFHKINPQSNLCCIESNLKLMENMHEGKVSPNLCKNGLLDYVTPLIIENRIIATIFLGQVLEKKPNMEFFKKQAKKYNYDEEKYLEAISHVPIVSKKQMKSLMDCMVRITKMLSKSALTKLREKKLQDSLDKSTKQKVELKDILEFSPIGIVWSDVSGKIEYVNKQFSKSFGYELEDLSNINEWYQKAFPDKKYRDEVILPWGEQVVLSKKEGTQVPELETNVRCKDGSEHRVLISISWVGEKRLANFSDITEHWKSELRNIAHDNMLDMVAKGSQLSDILYNIVQTVESEDSKSICSILLLDEEKKHLLIGASIKLPEFYNEAVNGIEIGIGVGSCGTAAYLAKRVIVEDIMTHKYWKGYTSLAQKAGLGACWSEPIICSRGKVLGTFAIYHKEPTTPSVSDIERISFAANLASIAIENRNARIELEHRAYSDYLTNLPNRRYFIEHSELELSRYHRYGGELSIVMFDIDFFKNLNDTYGHNIGDLVLQKISDISRNILRDIDIIGRIGGEEFAILLPQTNISEAINVAERLRIEISKGEISFGSENLSEFTASFGVADAQDCKSMDKLLSRADLALYEAKKTGRNKVCIYKKENE